MLMDLAAWPWTAMVVIGTVILGGALAWGLHRSSQVTPREEMVTEAATRDLHRRQRAPDFKD